MDDDFKPIAVCGLLIIGLAALLCWCASNDAKEREAFEAETTAQYNACIADKQSKWTCQALVESRKAQEAAKDAEQDASFAAGMTAVNTGMIAAGRK